MYLSNPKRVFLVLNYLLRHPTRTSDYFLHCCFSKSPLQKGLPWWSYEAIDWVAKNLKSSHSVFEWGSGGSSIFLSSLCQDLISVEHDLKWKRLVIEKLEELSIINVKVHRKDIDLSNQTAFKESEYYRALDKNYDFIVIDGEDCFGPDAKWSARETCFELAQRRINSNGVILVDDSWRYPNIIKESTARKIKSFQSIGPCRKGITSTDLHFY